MNLHWKSTNARAGMTLIEMLIAVTLTVMIMSFFTTLVVSANRGVSTARGIGEIDQRVRSAVSLIKDDLNHLFLQDRNGEPMSPADLFTSADKIPRAGYFTIEENFPSSSVPQVTAGNSTAGWSPGDFAATGLGNRQGVDQQGLPIDIDTDDVLAFTTELEGVTPGTFYWGRVPQFEKANFVSGGGAIPNVADLDNSLSPAASLDTTQRFNGMIASRFGEIIYFLRPNRAYAQPELNNPPNSSFPTATNPPAPATFTLYRRQLLVLPDSQVDNLEKNSVFPRAVIGLLNATQLGPSAAYYQHFDISAFYDPAVAFRKLRFNTPTTLAQRQNRYGMIPQDNTRTRELPFTGDGAGGPGQTTNINYPFGIHTPNDAWYGRPIQKETTYAPPGSPGMNYYLYSGATPDDPNAHNTLSAVSGFQDINGNGIADNYENNPSTRQGEDILLNNVISFDVKVLDDDYPLGTFRSDFDPLLTTGNTRDWPAWRTSWDLNMSSLTALGATPPLEPFNATNVTTQKHFVKSISVPGAHLDIDAPTTAVNPLFDPLDNTSDTTFKVRSFRRPEFVDIGYRASASILSAAAPPKREQSGYDLDQYYDVATALPGPPTVGNKFLWYVVKTPPPALPTLSAYFSDPTMMIGKHIPARWRTAGRAPGTTFNTGVGTAPTDKQGEGCGMTNAAFGAAGVNSRSPVNTYDSWWYKNVDGSANEWNDSRNIATPGRFRPPPYDRPLRAVQIKLRIWESKSNLVREFSIVHSFAKY